MAEIKNIITTDEKTFQLRFYEAVYGDDYAAIVTIDRSTDGYTEGVLFEHKQNLIAYGRAKALSQALIYLARFNVDGMHAGKRKNRLTGPRRQEDVCV